MSADDIDQEILETLDDVGQSLKQLADLDDDEREEMASLLDTLGHQDAAALVSPSRRGLLKTGASVGAGLLAGGAFGTAATRKASAGTDQSGTWGGPNDVQDVYAEDIYDDGDNIAMSFPGDGSVNIVNLNNTRFASQFGPSNTDGIQEAIDDLPAEGGTVRVDPGGGSGTSGEYLLTATLEITSDDVHLIIEEGSVVKADDGQDLGSCLSIREGGGVTVSGAGTIDANQSNQARATSPAILITDDTTVEDPTIDGLRLTGTLGRAIDVAPIQGNGVAGELTISRVKIEGHTGTGGNGAIYCRDGITLDKLDVVGVRVDRPTSDGRHVIIQDGPNQVAIRDSDFIIDAGTHRCIRSQEPTIVSNCYIGTSDLSYVGTSTGDMVNLQEGPSLAIGNMIVGGSDRAIVLGTNTISSDQHGLATVGNSVWRMGNVGIEAIGNSSGGDIVEPAMVGDTVFDCNQQGNSAGTPGANGFNINSAVGGHIAPALVGDSQGTATQEHPVRVGGSASDVSVDLRASFGHATDNGVDDSGTRTRINGTVFLGSAPSDSNYDAGDAGVEILDTSTSPEDLFKVLTDGSLTGAI